MVEREMRRQLEEQDPVTEPFTFKQSPRYRLNVLNCRGTEEMSTDDVFAYFSAYGPLSIEWVDDTTCECRSVS